MIERFQGENRGALVTSLLMQRFLQNRPDFADSLIAAGELVEYASGQKLITQGESTTDVFLIISGNVVVTANGVEIRTLSAGAHVGEMSAIDFTIPRSTSVTANGIVVALKVPAANFVEVCDQNEGAWKLVARELANRLFDRNRLIKPQNDKPKLFIISSVEARDVAREISSGLQYDCLPTVWNEGVFWAGGYPLEVLEEQVNKSDFAVAVAHFEDVVESRGGSHQAMRDNVLFELGMFIGRLGRHRSILAHPKLPNLTLPSDLHGIITASYIPPTTPEELPPRLSPVCSEIRKLMGKYGVHKHPG